ncbi:MAG: hypothetical protein JSS87_14170 [Acidobacteria bacterium]|nr:hypothetical protein [Acidobacteriota bacterium]
MSLPVAGTALYIADPYVTARSLSTPLLLAALIAVLDKKWLRVAILVVITLLLHPLMALWGAFFLAATAIAQAHSRIRPLLGFVIAALVALALVRLFSPEENLLAQTLAHSRSYWYLANWEWYEWIGMLAPPALLMALHFRSPWTSTQASLTRAAVAIFMLSGAASLLLVHPTSTHLLLARMQPLRMMHFAYLVFLFLLGAKVGSFVENVRSLRILPIVAGFVIAGCALFLMQRSLYASSNHIELPNSPLRNPWEQAFIWIREHTPVDAIVAMDAHYISTPGEDAQSFRALAQRSCLPDYSKDGGVASVYRVLAPKWQRGEHAQQDLNQLNDVERLKQLHGTKASWILLPAASQTAFACLYQNNAVKVCRLPVSY